MVPLLAVLALVVDSGGAMLERQRLQTAVEAAALVAARDQMSGHDGCLGSTAYVATNFADASTVNCESSGTDSRGTITLTASAHRRIAFPELLRRDGVTVSASAGVAIGGATTVTGLRPLSLCRSHPAFQTWLTSMYTDQSFHRIDVESQGTECDGAGGNWGILDLDGGSNSNAETQERIDNGFGLAVNLGQRLPGDPGIPAPSISIDNIVGRPIVVPVVDDVMNDGKQATFRVAGFAALIVHTAMLSGPTSDRHLIVQFTRNVGSADPTGCCAGPAELHGGITVASICSLDSFGEC